MGKQHKDETKCIHYEGLIVGQECGFSQSECSLNTRHGCEFYAATEAEAETNEKRINDFLNGETEELPDGTEIIPEAEAAKLENKAVKSEPVAEEKQFLNKKENLLKEIGELKEKNVVLEKEAEKFDKLASTMNTEPFIELKTLVKETIKTYTDREDVKELKKKIKNFESISQMENLLIEYKNLAEENRQTIVANNNDISNYKEEIEEIDSKIKHFQTKLDLGEKGEESEV